MRPKKKKVIRWKSLLSINAGPETTVDHEANKTNSPLGVHLRLCELALAVADSAVSSDSTYAASSRMRTGPTLNQS